jgi:hypothetical protein
MTQAVPQRACIRACICQKIPLTARRPFPAHGVLWQSENAMSFDVSVTQKQFYTRVAIAGSPGIDQLVSLVHVLGLDSAGWKHDILLVDLRKVSTQFTEAEQRTLGLEAAASLGHLRKVASVVPRDRVTRISEKAARRDGTKVTVFDDEKEALAWLQAKD